MKKLLWFVFYSLPLVAFAANLTEPRAEAVQPQPVVENFDGPVKVIIHKSHRTEVSDASSIQGNPVRPRGRLTAAETVKAYIEVQALKYGVNPSLAVWIVKHESSFNPRAKGDGEASRGLWQISRIYHPEVSDAAAFGVASSTQWSLARIRAGKASEWATYHYCRTLYKDCPF